MVTEVNPPTQTPEPLPEPAMEDVKENQEAPPAVDDETLSDALLDDELHLPMMNSMFDLFGVDEQATLPFEQLDQTKAELHMESFLSEIHLGLDE